MKITKCKLKQQENKKINEKNSKKQKVKKHRNSKKMKKVYFLQKAKEQYT